MNWSVVGAAALALAVIIGAFGAHALEGRLDAYSKGVYETGVMYHFFHALGLLIVSFLPRIGALPAARASWVCALLAAGIVLFSGSLYALAISGVRMLGAITPSSEGLVYRGLAPAGVLAGAGPLGSWPSTPAEFEARCQWGLRGLKELAPIAEQHVTDILTLWIFASTSIQSRISRIFSIMMWTRSKLPRC